MALGALAPLAPPPSMRKDKMVENEVKTEWVDPYFDADIIQIQDESERET